MSDNASNTTQKRYSIAVITAWPSKDAFALHARQAPKPKHGTATETPAADECKPDIGIKGKIDDTVSDLLSKSFERISK